jgi:hypothetical protein
MGRWLVWSIEKGQGIFKNRSKIRVTSVKDQEVECTKNYLQDSLWSLWVPGNAF